MTFLFLQNFIYNTDKYKSIRVRVSGFSATFVNLTESLQDDVIARTVNPV